MYRKLLFIEIVLALGIPALPLGAILSLTTGTRNKIQPPNVPPGENPMLSVGAAGSGTEEQTVPPVFPAPVSIKELPTGKASPEQLALAFRPPAPNTVVAVPATGKRAGEGNAASPAASPEKYRRDDKFKHLGSIRDGGDREWLYFKDNESGRIIAVSPDGASRNGIELVSADTESYVITKDNIEYLIRRN
ncbi:hypothetical protein TREPR_1388 [Treponema primitia ZAS-2]|uniref:Uncharacterized protein n=1 Tax=Treponema primitia (strain ATCC BAA-887 / DSM 12427 / ZAS-2) TaxID=545694 RepID=F5YQQ3_TREPZ|nr:hypothetical protein [Treponema primitia]AEF85688.1 hypothetical protein TREPR_1388 [Treponema primitia ZAS-2]